MGGDGGVIASNRKYMRGAGTADHTGDLNRHAAQKFNAQEVMKTCALTKTPLHTSVGNTIVTDPYGSLYHKEAAVQALLTRKQAQEARIRTNTNCDVLRHLGSSLQYVFSSLFVDYILFADSWGGIGWGYEVFWEFCMAFEVVWSSFKVLLKS